MFHSLVPVIVSVPVPPSGKFISCLLEEKFKILNQFPNNPPKSDTGVWFARYQPSPMSICPPSSSSDATSFISSIVDGIVDSVVTMGSASVSTGTQFNRKYHIEIRSWID